MEDEDDEDFYAPDENFGISEPKEVIDNDNRNTIDNKVDDEEEGEEIEEDGSDSDIDIITERKGDSKTANAQPLKVKEAKPTLAKISAPELSRASSANHVTSIKSESSGRETPAKPGTSFPAYKSSDVDVDAKPIYGPAGKPITDLDMDIDFPEEDKPWRRPGTDLTDYFNYGFDEFTWASYCLKQSTLHKEVIDSKKQMEEMQNFLSTGMAGMPAMPGAQPNVGGGAQSMSAIGGPGDVPPEMQQMFQQMMAQGMDPMQMDAGQFMQMMQGGQMNGSSQAFGGQTFGQQNQNQNQNQQMTFGYGIGGGGGGGGASATSANRNTAGRGQVRRW